MPKRSSNTKQDANQLARSILLQATGGEEIVNFDQFEGKNPAAVLLGRKGGLKGGKARAESLSAKRRKEIARNAAQARWKNDGDNS